MVSPLSPHLPYDVSGAQRVDPLQTLYKMTKPHLTNVRFYYSYIHHFYVLERKLT